MVHAGHALDDACGEEGGMTTASSGIGRSNMPLDAGKITHGAMEVGLAPGGSAPAVTTTTVLRGGQARSIRALLALQLRLQTIGIALVAGEQLDRRDGDRRRVLRRRLGDMRPYH